jgi:hypothetical protein
MPKRPWQVYQQLGFVLAYGSPMSTATTSGLHRRVGVFLHSVAWRRRCR